MTRKKAQHINRPQDLDQGLPQPRDPLGSLPNTCVYTILELFTVVELIAIRRVSCGWKDAVDWMLAGIMRECRPELAEGATDGEQATLEFRREIYRQEARKNGRPTFVREFTYVWGFAMCGDYFCWIDKTCLNVQLVFNRNKTSRFPRVERYRLTLLLRADKLVTDYIKSQEVGSVTDRPLLVIRYGREWEEGASNEDGLISPRQVLETRPLLIDLLLHVETCPQILSSFPFFWVLTGYRMAVICVKSGTALWSTAHDEHPDSSTPWGRHLTLNHTALAYITRGQQGPTLCVRSVLTGQMKATKPIPPDFYFYPLSEGASIQLHPRRDLVYLTFLREARFFSATTANCAGRLSVARVSSINHTYYRGGPLKLRFSEHQPKYSPSGREKFFLYQCDIKADPPGYYCFEYEVPTAEDISTEEARILRNGDQESRDNLIFKVLRIQIYEHRTWGTSEGPPELNPMLKQAAQTETCLVRGKGCTRIRFHSYAGHRSLPASTYDIFMEPEKRYDGSIPVEFYPSSGKGVLVTKPKRALGHVRRHNERVECNLPLPFIASVTLTERYMLTPQGYVYLFGYEPRW